MFKTVCSDRVTFSIDLILLLCFQLTVLQGDIVKVSADAIVHPTNSAYYMGGEVGKQNFIILPSDSHFVHQSSIFLLL